MRQRLTAEINYQDSEHAKLLDLEAAGKETRIKPETAFKRARNLEHRLATRLADLDADAQLRAHPPVVAGIALVIPQGLLDRMSGKRSERLRAMRKTRQKLISAQWPQ